MRPLWTDQSASEPGRAPIGWDEPILGKDRLLGRVILDSLDRSCVGKRIGTLPQGIVHQCPETCVMHNRTVPCCRVAGHYGLHWPSSMPYLVRIEGQDA